MIPILYGSDETAFTTNGLGPLPDAAECTVEEEINGVYQLHMVYPVDGINFANIKPLNIIKVVPAVGATAQPFDIIRVSTPRFGVVEIDAKHISYRLNKNTVMPFSVSNELVSTVLNAIKSHRVESDGFNYNTASISDRVSFAVAEPCSVRSALKSLIEVLGKGEYIWSGFGVSLMARRGADKDITVQYGINITDFKQEKSIEESLTGIVPYWKGRDAGGNDVVVTLAQKVVHISGYSAFPYQRSAPVDFSSEFKEKPTESQLLSAAQNYITANNIAVPKVSMDVSFVHLPDTEEYKTLTYLDKASLGDGVKVNYAKLGVTATARVIRTVYDVLNGRYKEISIGDAKIRGQSAQGAVAPVKKQVSQISNAVTAMTENEASRVTLPSNFTNHGEARNFYNRKGNICMVGLDCTPSAHVSGQTLFTLPTSCRPVAALRYSVLPGVSRSSDDGGDHYVIINTDGTVTYTGTGRVFNTFTYICNGG